jgi:hypothetical protein
LLDFLLSWSLDAFYPFFLLQNTLNLQIIKFSFLFGFAMKLSKPDSLKWETGWSSFFRLAKFGHQQAAVVGLTLRAVLFGWHHIIRNLEHLQQQQ